MVCILKFNDGRPRTIGLTCKVIYICMVIVWFCMDSMQEGRGPGTLLAASAFPHYLYFFGVASTVRADETDLKYEITI